MPECPAVESSPTEEFKTPIEEREREGERECMREPVCLVNPGK